MCTFYEIPSSENETEMKTISQVYFFKVIVFYGSDATRLEFNLIILIFFLLKVFQIEYHLYKQFSTVGDLRCKNNVIVGIFFFYQLRFFTLQLDS